MLFRTNQEGGQRGDSGLHLTCLFRVKYSEMYSGVEFSNTDLKALRRRDRWCYGKIKEKDYKKTTNRLISGLCNKRKGQ